MYWGDYLRDTRNLTTLQHGAYLLLIAHYWQNGKLPDDDRQLAVITGLNLQKWRVIKGPIAEKFREGWKHKRVETELLRADKKMVQAIRAGKKGGHRSAMARNKAFWEATAQASASASASASGQADAQAPGQAKTKRRSTTHTSECSSLTSSELRPPVENQQGASLPASSLATALAEGALARSPLVERGQGKQAVGREEAVPRGPSTVTRAEFDAILAAKRKGQNP
jgi:uncharacterized protein YdaU (DUF1376 family)